MIAVWPRRGSFACTSAPRASSSRTASSLARARRGHQHAFPRRAATRSDRRPRSSSTRRSPRCRSAGERQRRDAVAVRRSHVGAGREQPVDEIEIIVIRRPVQRRHAVRLRAFDVDRLLEQLPDGGAIAPLHGISERRPVRSAAGPSDAVPERCTARPTADAMYAQRMSLTQPASPTGLNSVSILPVLSANESSRTPTAVEQRQVQVGQRRRLGVPDVPAAAHSAGRAAGDDDRQVHVIVDVGIAHAAAVQIKRMVEQRAVALGVAFSFSR